MFITNSPSSDFVEQLLSLASVTLPHLGENDLGQKYLKERWWLKKSAVESWNVVENALLHRIELLWTDSQRFSGHFTVYHCVVKSIYTVDRFSFTFLTQLIFLVFVTMSVEFLRMDTCWRQIWFGHTQFNWKKIQLNHLTVTGNLFEGVGFHHYQWIFNFFVLFLFHLTLGNSARVKVSPHICANPFHWANHFLCDNNCEVNWMLYFQIIFFSYRVFDL